MKLAVSCLNHSIFVHCVQYFYALVQYIILHFLVQVTNNNKVINGIFMDNYGIRRTFETTRFPHATKKTSLKMLRFFNVKCSVPSIPSTVVKKLGGRWYICLERDGVFTIKFHNLIEKSDYLIAQMENNDKFCLHPDSLTRFTFSNNF